MRIVSLKKILNKELSTIRDNKLPTIEQITPKTIHRTMEIIINEISYKKA